MNNENRSAFVRLRLRIVKIKGPEVHVHTNMTVITGNKFFKIAPTQSEWCIIELDSLDEKIIFQTALGSVSCKCRDLDGRRRLDFPKSISVLIEAYWVIVFPEPVVLRPSGPSVTQLTSNCEIHFMATKGTAGYDPLTDSVSSFGPGVSSVDELDEMVESDKGPVAKAMQWLKETTFTLPDSASILLASKRIKYEPSKEPDRLAWSPEMTAMQRRTRSRLDVIMEPVNTQTQLDGILRNVNVALNLKKVYL